MVAWGALVRGHVPSRHQTQVPGSTGCAVGSAATVATCRMFKGPAQEFDSSKWQKMCHEAEADAGQQAPVIWLFTEPSLYGVSSRLAFTPRPDGRLHLSVVLKGLK